jgi:K+-transporting ATPase ATPase B chain
MEVRKPVTLGKDIVRQAIIGAFTKLDPRVQLRNPVMFVVEVGSVITTVIHNGYRHYGRDQ